MSPPLNPPEKQAADVSKFGAKADETARAAGRNCTRLSVSGIAAISSRLAQASPHHGSWPKILTSRARPTIRWRRRMLTPLSPNGRAFTALGASPARKETVDGQTRQVWSDVDGNEVIEKYTIAGVGHPRRLHSLADASCGPPQTGTVGPASRPAAGAMLTLLRLSRSPPAAGANFLRPARDNCPLLRTRAELRLIRRLSLEGRPRVYIEKGSSTRPAARRTATFESTSNL